MKTVLELTPAQVGQLHELYQNEWWTRGRTLDETRRAVAASQVCVALIDEKEQLRAFARVLTDGVFKAFVFDVIVDQACRGQHMGQRLMRAVLDHPSVSAARHVELYCLPELVPFYRRYGFTIETAGVALMRRSQEPSS